MNLTPRLLALAGELNQCKILIDVGTDHGYLPIFAVQQNLAAKALALDIKEIPLQGAEANVKDYNLTNKIECRLSDGLQNVEMKEIEAIVIAGMGGYTIKNILQMDLTKAQKAKYLLLQPNNGQERLRRWLSQVGFKIIAEGVVQERKHFYQWMKIVFDGQKREISNFEAIYGNPANHNNIDITIVWLNKEKSKVEKILKNLALAEQSDPLREGHYSALMAELKDRIKQLTT